MQAARLILWLTCAWLGMVPTAARAQPAEVLATQGGLSVRWAGRTWSLAPWTSAAAMPPGAEPPRGALLVAERDDRLLVAVRCALPASARCPTWVGAFDRSGALLFGRHTSTQLPIVSESAFGVAIDTGGEVEVLAWSTGAVLTRFSLGVWTSAARLLDDGTYVWNDGMALHARAADGRERWQVPGAWVVGAGPDGIVAMTQHDQRVVDPLTGETRCRRMVPGGSYASVDGDVGARIRHVCQAFPSSVGRLRGAVRIDGRPGAGVRILLGGETVTTDRAGWFSVDFGAVGRVRVRPDAEHVSRARGNRCLLTRDVYVELPEDGREAHVLVDIETFRPLCRSGGCDLVDCE